jgi:sirohydrochlorin ferrochelatase
MAHGGTDQWDQAVEAAVAPLAAALPTRIAFGMADAVSLGTALEALRAEGVRRVAVVRLFLSGASFRHQTEYLLGLSDARPTVFAPAHGAGHGADASPPQPIHHGLEIATHEDGIVDSEEAARVLADRARAVSRDPAAESVLLLAHGMGDPRENDELLAAMRAIEQQVWLTGFHGVYSATLREDWAEARAIAEREVRALVESENNAGRRVLVVPVRVSGFGPYADVLEGLDYTATDGLLPHSEVSRWLGRKVEEIATANGWAWP